MAAVPPYPDSRPVRDPFDDINPAIRLMHSWVHCNPLHRRTYRAAMTQITHFRDVLSLRDTLRLKGKDLLDLTDATLKNLHKAAEEFFGEYDRTRDQATTATKYINQFYTLAKNYARSEEQLGEKPHWFEPLPPVKEKDPLVLIADIYGELFQSECDF